MVAVAEPRYWSVILLIMLRRHQGNDLFPNRKALVAITEPNQQHTVGCAWKKTAKLRRAPTQTAQRNLLRKGRLDTGKCSVLVHVETIFKASISQVATRTGILIKCTTPAQRYPTESKRLQAYNARYRWYNYHKVTIKK